MDKFVLKIASLAQLLCVSYAQFDFFGSSLGILNGYEYPSSTGFGLNVKEKWIEQPLNHFDRQDVRTWKMRYLQNEQYYVEGGPIFIFVGGESTVSKIWLENSHMHDMARDLNGTMFHTEHRYYGQSRPTENISVESMRFLNVDQALADLAHFISFVKRTYPGLSDARVVIVGVSYAASMVTWFMQKYPHLIDGAWSSSAPVFAHVNFIEYKERTSKAIAVLGGTECMQIIQRGFKDMEMLVKKNNTNRLNESFDLCKPIFRDNENTFDVWSFFAGFANFFSRMVQSVPGQVSRFCNTIVNPSHIDAIDALTAFFNDLRGTAQNCWDISFDTQVNSVNSTEWVSNSNLRAWMYQTCSEFGWYHTSGSLRQIFGSSFPAKLFKQLCIDGIDDVLFTPENILRNARRTNVIFGGFNPSVLNVYTTHGELDQWQAIGVQEEIDESSPVVVLPRETHGSDLSSISVHDSPEMVASKKRIFELVQQWVGVVV